DLDLEAVHLHGHGAIRQAHFADLGIKDASAAAADRPDERVALQDELLRRVHQRGPELVRNHFVPIPRVAAYLARGVAAHPLCPLPISRGLKPTSSWFH